MSASPPITDATRLALAAVPSSLLARIYYGLHELKDPTMRWAILDIIWLRNATLGGPWPTRTIRYGTTGDPDAKDRGELAIVSCCGAGQGPDDPLHQPAQTLDFTSEDCHALWGILCTCGRRSDLSATSPRHLRLRPQQVMADARIWPVVIRDGVRYFHVCPDAKHVEDPEHAPLDIGIKCLCGRMLDRSGKFLANY